MDHSGISEANPAWEAAGNSWNFFFFFPRELRLEMAFCIHRLQNQLCVVTIRPLGHLTAEDDLLLPGLPGGAVPAALVQQELLSPAQSPHLCPCSGAG